MGPGPAPDPGREPALVISRLLKTYGETVAIADLSLEVRRGSIAAILGPNGAGKTTTVECCEGYRRPDAGFVRVLGLDPWRESAKLRPRLGVMLQGGGAYPGATAAEMLDHVAALYAHPIKPRLLIERLGLQAAGRTAYRRLSGGQQRRLALAMAVIGRPELVFLDEPTSGLDPQARLAAWELILELQRAGVTVILTTHLMDEAERLADLVFIVDRGRLAASGSPQELAASEPGAQVITFRGPAHLDLASLRQRLPPEAVAREAAPGSYVVSGVTGPEVLAHVAAWCGESGFMPGDLSVGRRTLEDVFLDLTGRSLRA